MIIMRYFVSHERCPRLQRVMELFVGLILFARGSEAATIASQKTVAPADSQDATAKALTTDIEAVEAVVAVGNDRRYFCSGTIVARRFVLTARHCLPATRVATGVNSDEPKEILRVVQSFSHPDPAMDVALLLLSPPRDQLPSLSWRGTDEKQAPTGEALLVGYGAQPPHRYGVRRALSVPISDWGCDALRTRVTGCHAGRELVLPRLRGTDTCDGDSGGPVLELSDHGYRILAITSRPIAAYRLRCGDGGVYVRADVIADWVNATLQTFNRSTRQ